MVQRYKKNRTYANAQCDLCCITYGAERLRLRGERVKGLRLRGERVKDRYSPILTDYLMPSFLRMAVGIASL